MKYKAVLFDLDGVLADTSEYILAGAAHALATVGAPPMTREQMARHGGVPAETVFGILAPGRDGKALASAFNAFERDHVELVREYAGVRETLGGLQSRHIRLAIVTGNNHDYAERVLGSINCRSFFSVIVGSEDTTKHKPDPAPFALAVQKLSLQPPECLVVGDSPHDMTSGRAAACKVALAAYGFASSAAMPFKPDYEIDSIKEVLDLVQ